METRMRIQDTIPLDDDATGDIVQWLVEKKFKSEEDKRG